MRQFTADILAATISGLIVLAEIVAARMSATISGLIVLAVQKLLNW